MKLKLPQHSRLVFKEAGNKNSVTQLIEKEKEIEYNIISKSRSGLLIDSKGVNYYLTANKNGTLDKVKNVLLSNMKPTSDSIQNTNFEIKKWLKHPKMSDYSVDQVLVSWKNEFKYIEEDNEHEILGLRQPQIGAIHMLMGHLTLPLDTATIVLPTGTGKTETMISILVAKQCKRVLVIVPSDSLRNQIALKFQEFGLLKQFGLIGEGALYPFVGVLFQRFSSDKSLQSFLMKCNVVVSTMNILTMLSENQLKIVDSFCSHIFIDEAHHVKASTWGAFKEKFSPSKIIQFTATPFRNDGKRLDGKIIFDFPLSEAQRQGYFKKIDFLPVRIFDSHKADIEISVKAIQKLREDISNGFNHILMARCETKERAEEIFKLYESQKDLDPVVIYSGCKNFRETYKKILHKETKIIVCVNMLGEGFDLPELKIAAFHDIRKSLPITLQFAGRFTRTKSDKLLGNASFIANIADPVVSD
jgi:superfamily II DNA or RNA helicase